MAARTPKRKSREFAQGPVYDPTSDRYFVEIVLPNGRRLRKPFGRCRLAERWWSVQVAAIDDGSWNTLAPRTIAAVAVPGRGGGAALPNGARNV